MRRTKPFRSIEVVTLATIFVVAVCLSVITIDLYRTYNARTLQLDQGKVAAENVAHAMAQQASDTLQHCDAVLIGLVDRVQSGSGGPVDLRSLHRLLMHYASATPEFQLVVVDEHGRWVTSSLPGEQAAIESVSRIYFSHHRSDSDPSPFLGPVIRMEPSNRWVLTLSRRINRPDGTFGGVALVSIDLRYFDRFLAQLDVGAHGALTLATHGGTLIHRRPALPSAIGTNQSGSALFLDHISKSRSGVVTVVSSLDGFERLIAYITLDDYPLAVIAALSTGDILAGWRADAVTHTTFIAMLVAALALLGFFLVRQIDQKATVQKELAASQSTLEATNQILSVMANKDGLTGLVNRRELDRVLGQEIGRAERSRMALTVIMLDVDHFKRFNDRYGHMAGDDCLRRVAVALGASVRRPGDVVGRFGGEEFVAVLPGIDAKGADTVAAVLCQSIRDLAIVHASSPKGIVTISAGIAVLHATTPDCSTSDLLDAADKALYEAKRGGRDRYSRGVAPAELALG